MSERLLTAEELGVRLGVKPRWLLAKARANEIPHVPLGRYVRFDVDDVDRWLESMKRGGGPGFQRRGSS